MRPDTDLDQQHEIRGGGVEPVNRWLSGPYAPVVDELTVSDLRVVGALPEGLRGSYLRNGPNPLFDPIGRYHLFDGDGMVHGVSFDGRGGASYRNRWVRGRGLAGEIAAGHAIYGGLGEFVLPPAEVAERYGMMKNTANTHVIAHGGRVLALMEACPPIELDDALTTIGDYDFAGTLVGSMTAHPKVDPVTGELVFFGYGPFPPYLRVHTADASGALTWSTEVELPGPVMMHDFLVTATRIVIFDLPAVFDVPAMLSGGNGVRWEPDRGARIGVLERGAPGDTIRWIDVDPFWAFHFLNAHDDGEAVVATGCRADRLNVDFSDGPVEHPAEPSLHRWRIDPVRGLVSGEALTDEPGDFPRFDERRAGLEHRYGYVGHTRRWSPDEIEFDGLVKHDLVTGASSTVIYGSNHVSGEAVFVADPARTAEDAGWLLNFVTDRTTGETSLAVLDAETLERAAAVIMPRRVPFGFHGSFVPAED